MSECERISDLFGELHDNQAEGIIEKHAREHLYECSGCREDFKWYGITVQALNRLDRVSPPPDFLTQLNSRLETSPSFFDFFRNLFVGVPYVPLPVGAAALALIVVTSIALYNNPQISTPIETASVAQPSPSALPSSGAGRVTADVVSMRPKSIPATTGSMYANQQPGAHLLPSYTFPRTVADKIGADNLTVESASIDNAVESLKKLLPGLQGRLVDVQSQHNRGETVLAVVIPSEAYGNLTTELINHGAVAAGATGTAIPQAPAKQDGNNVLLYIRFVHSR
jgi:hypothetical protein